MLVIEIAAGMVLGYLVIRFWRVWLITLGVIAAIIAAIIGALVFKAQIAPHLVPMSQHDLEGLKSVIGWIITVGVIAVTIPVMVYLAVGVCSWIAWVLLAIARVLVSLLQLVLWLAGEPEPWLNRVANWLDWAMRVTPNIQNRII
jgi:hypothetical protein